MGLFKYLYGHLPPITKTIQVRRTRHAGHCWRSRDELISDVLLWTPTHGRAKAGWLARTYIQQLCEDTGCCPEDLPEAMKDKEKWRGRVRDIRATSTTWWWWWWYEMFYLFKKIRFVGWGCRIRCLWRSRLLDVSAGEVQRLCYAADITKASGGASTGSKPRWRG